MIGLDNTIDVTVHIDREISIEYFDQTFSRFEEWNKTKREIKINSLLNPEIKLKFDVESIKTTTKAILGFFGAKERERQSLSTLSFIVESMSFVIKNVNIVSIDIKIKPLNKENSELIRELQNKDVLVIKIGGDENYFDHFYIETPNLAA